MWCCEIVVLLLALVASTCPATSAHVKRKKKHALVYLKIDF